MFTCKVTAISAMIVVLTLGGSRAAWASFEVSDDEDWCSEAFQRGLFGYTNEGAELAVVDQAGKKDGDETYHDVRIIDANEPQRVLATYKAVIVSGGSDGSWFVNCNTESSPYKDFLAYWSARRFVTAKGEWTEAQRDADLLKFPGRRVTLPVSRVISGPEKSLEVCATHSRWGFYIVPMPNGNVIVWMEQTGLDPSWSSKQKKATLPKCKYAQSAVSPGWVVLAVLKPGSSTSTSPSSAQSPKDGSLSKSVLAAVRNPRAIEDGNFAEFVQFWCVGDIGISAIQRDPSDAENASFNLHCLTRKDPSGATGGRVNNASKSERSLKAMCWAKVQQRANSSSVKRASCDATTIELP